MTNTGTGPAGDFEAVARRYWQALGEAMRVPASGTPQMAYPGAAPSWQEALEWWSRLVPHPSADVNRTMERFNAQAAEWFDAMQQVAARFASRSSTPAEIVTAWREALGGDAGHLFQTVFAALRGSGQSGIDPWLEQASHYLEAWYRQGTPWLQASTFGPAREHQARWQALAGAQQEYQKRLQAYTKLMQRSFDLAFELFESKLAEHDAPGRQLTSARALFDLWIDAAEEAYAGIAMSDDFQQIYAALGNAQMRLRAALQREVEQLCNVLGMPGRTEVDAAHHKIVELQRAVRRLEAALAETIAPDTATPSTRARPASKSNTGRVAKKQAVASKVAPKVADKASAKSAGGKHR